MFLAIINDTYAEVKAEINDSADEFRLVDYFKSSYAKMFNKLSKEREQLEDIQSALKVSHQGDSIRDDDHDRMMMMMIIIMAIGLNYA